MRKLAIVLAKPRRLQRLLRRTASLKQSGKEPLAPSPYFECSSESKQRGDAMMYNHGIYVLVPFEREPRKCRVNITRRDRVKLTFSDTKLDEFVTDAEIATVDEAIQKAKHLLDAALVY